MDGSDRSDDTLPGPAVTSARHPRDEGIVPVRPIRRAGRAPDRAALVAVTLVAFVALALVKPWQLGPPPAEQAGSPGPDQQADGSDPGGSSAGPTTGAPDQASQALEGAIGSLELGLPVLRWDDVRALGRPPDAWGVRAIVARPDRLPADRPAAADETLVQDWFVSSRWAAASPISLGLPSASFDFRLHPRPLGPGGVVVPTDRQAVAAIGVTTPPDDVPLDLRVWRLHEDRVPERLVVREMIGREPGGQRLFLPPRSGDPSRDHWAPGMYRIDLLMGNRLSRLTVLLPGRRETAAEGGGEERLDFAALGARLREMPAGPFLVDVHGTTRHVRGAVSQPLDDRAAWLLAGRRPGPGEANVVPRIAADDVAAIGFKLGRHPGARVLDAVLHRLAPEGGGPPIARLVTSRPHWRGSPLRTRIAWAVSAEEGGTLTWAPGNYRIDVRWTDADGLHRGSWHFDLVPAATPVVEPPFLAAVRDWAGYAGRPGVVVGTARQHEGGPRSARIRHQPQAPGSAESRPERLGSRCSGGALVDPGHRLLGIGHQGGGSPSVVVQRRFEGGASLDQPVASVTSAVAGLAIIGSAEGGSWRPGIYEVVLAWARAAEQRFVVCVGRHESGGLRVPPSAVSSEAYELASRGVRIDLGAIWPGFHPRGGAVMLPR